MHIHFIEAVNFVSCHNKVPAIRESPLLPAPNHSRWGVTFSLAVELGRLPHSHRHIFWLQYQHGFGCSGREENSVLYTVWLVCKGGSLLSSLFNNHHW